MRRQAMAVIACKVSSYATHMEVQRHSYGPDVSQWADLHLPDVQKCSGVVVVIHGGYWRSAYSADLGTTLATDLAAHGMVAWNMEYRRMGNGGGWPTTFEDIAAGIDALAKIEGLNLTKVVALGHSAGGQLAAWAGARCTFPTGAVGSAPRVQVTGVVSQSGLLNLAEAVKLRLSNNAARKLAGQHLAQADPLQLLPSVPLYAVHAVDDVTVPSSQSKSYVEAAVALGSWAELVEVPGDHSSLIDVQAPAYHKCRELVVRLLERE